VAASEQVPEHFLYGDEPSSDPFRLLILDATHHAGDFGRRSMHAVVRAQGLSCADDECGYAPIVIAESQARALLEECEGRLGRRLEGLRDQLLLSDNTLGALWELVVLHVSMQLGPGVDHEPAPGTPDVVLRVPSVPPFSIEATHVRWPDRDEQELRFKFLGWVRASLRKHGVDPSSYHPRLDPSDPGSNSDIVPKEHQWKTLLRTDQWERVVDAAKRPPSEIKVQLPPPFRADLSIKFLGFAREALSAGFRAAQSVERVSDHPVYSAVRSKADQARKWKREEPLIVCVGSSLAPLFPMNEARPGAWAAVVAALTDTSRWSVMDRHNHLRDSTPENYRVRGAERISGVLLVSIEDRPALGWQRSSHNRFARVHKLITNPDASFPLNETQLASVSRLDFNTFPFGPQWEIWRAPSARGWRDPNRIMNRDEPGKTTSLGGGTADQFTLQFAAEDLVKLLAGTDPEKGLREAIDGVHASFRLRDRPIIKKIELVAGDAKQRKPDMVKVTFGTRPEPLVQGLKNKARPRSEPPASTGESPSAGS
jgi:hypothetical protein